MSTVRCPNCQRVLHLPESQEVQTAQCPLCRTTFEPPATTPIPVIPAGPTLPTEVVLPFPIDPEADPVPSKYDRILEKKASATEDTPARRAIRWPVRGLQACGTLAIVYSFTCGCADVLIDSDPYRAQRAEALLAIWLIGVLGGFFLFTAAESLSRRRSRIHALLGGMFALLLGARILFRLSSLVLFATARQHAFQKGYYLLFPGCVGLIQLLVGAQTLRVLFRRDVRALFQR